MGNVCSCLRGSGSYSPNSGKEKKSSNVDQNGSPEDAVSGEVAKGGEDVRKPSATEVELEIVPSASGAQENIKSDPSFSTVAPSPPEDKDEPKLVEEASEVSNKESKPREIEQINDTAKDEDTVVASSSSMKTDNEVPKASASIQVDLMEAQSGEKVSVADKKEIGAENTETKNAEEIGLKDEAVEKSSTSMAIGDKNTEITASPEAEEVIATSTEGEQGEVKKSAQAVSIDHESQTEVSSKSDVEAIQEEIGLKADILEQHKEPESALPTEISAPAQDAASELLPDIKSSDVSHEDVTVVSSLPEKEEELIQAEKLQETTLEEPNFEQKPTSVELNMDNTALSSQQSPPATKEESASIEDNEHIESSRPVQSLDLEAANDSNTEAVESVVDPLPTDDTIQPAENNVPEAPSEQSELNNNVPSNTPIDAEFLPLEAIKEGGESTLLNELGLSDDQPKSSSLLDEVQKYVEEMVNDSVAVVEGEIQKDDEMEPNDKELSASHSEDLDEKVLDKDVTIQVVEDKEHAEPFAVEEATIVDENHAQESISQELRAIGVETITVVTESGLSTTEEKEALENSELEQTATAMEAGDKEMPKQSPELELSVEEFKEQEEEVLSKALPNEDIATDTALQEDLDDSIPEQLTTSSERIGEDSMMDSVLSLLQEKFSSSTSQDVETED